MQSSVIVFGVKFIVSILPLIMFDLGIVLGVRRVLMCINLQQCLFILSWLCSWSDLKIQLPAHYSTQTHNVQLARHSVLSPLHISSDCCLTVGSETRRAIQRDGEHHPEARSGPWLLRRQELLRTWHSPVSQRSGLELISLLLLQWQSETSFAYLTLHS